MKTLNLNRFGQVFLCFAIAALSFAFTAPSPDKIEETPPPRWEKLGQRAVNYGLDRDEIAVTARDGRFTAIKLMIKKSPINLHRVVIHFGNGTKQEVNVRNKIPAGGETRVIDIQGGRRVISKVVFRYDTKGLLRMRSKGVVELWGRH